MSFPSITNVDGSNPGPNSAAPDFPQSSIGNVWKFGSFTLTISPAAVAANTSAEQTFTLDGLLETDFVAVSKPTAQAGLGIVGARVSAANTLAITFGNFTAASITPTAAETYQVGVIRVQPNATQMPNLFDY